VILVMKQNYEVESRETFHKLTDVSMGWVYAARSESSTRVQKPDFEPIGAPSVACKRACIKVTIIM
jgi:hypothetical protein